MKIDANNFTSDVRLSLIAENDAENHQLKWLKIKILEEGGKCGECHNDDGFKAIVVKVKLQD